MGEIILYISYVGAVYGLFKVIYDLVKRKKWSDIRKSHEFVILIISIIVAACFFTPWNKFHYGDQSVKIIYKDTSKKAITPINKPDSNKKQVISPLSEKSPAKHNPKRQVKMDTAKKLLIPPVNGIVSTGANAHNVTGTGNQVGVNGDIYTGIKQRVIDDKIIDQIVSGYNLFKHPFVMRRSNDAETASYAKSIEKKLNERGIKIESDLIDIIGFKLPNNPLGLLIDTSTEKFILIIGSQENK